MTDNKSDPRSTGGAELLPESNDRDNLIDRIENAIDRVHDMDVTFRDYATAVADEIMPLVEAVGTLAKATDRLVTVCGRTGNALTDFEEAAALFRAETGKMRPGKDAPSAAPDLAATREEYRAWLDGIVVDAQKAEHDARTLVAKAEGA